MENEIKLIASRIKDLREILEITPEEMAKITGKTTEKYLEYETGEKDFGFTFLLKCANRFGVDMVELVSGDEPKLSYYSVVKKGEGLPIKRREGFSYLHLAYKFKGKKLEPFLVTAKYDKKLDENDIELSTHKGQEFDIVLNGKLKVKVHDKVEILSEGDSIYYNSAFGHGMVATGGKDCEFLAVVMNEEEE